MKSYKGYLIDLDGTVYRGSEAIAEAVEFVNQLAKKKLPYLFVTNNSTKRPEDVAAHLRGMGVKASEHHVFTTSMATAAYLSTLKAQATVYAIGEEGLRSALTEAGHKLTEEDPEFVIIGLDRQVTYEKLAKAAHFVRNGAKFIATNGDVALPVEGGFLPGNGSIVSVVTVSTGVNPLFIGKPESIIIEQALQVIGTEKEETIMIGDNYQTDILAGINAGLDTLIVYTGVTTKEQVSEYEKKPTFEVDQLSEWQ